MFNWTLQNARTVPAALGANAANIKPVVIPRQELCFAAGRTNVAFSA